jgi:hypothetical protein
MKGIMITLMLLSGFAAAYAENGEKPSKDTNQKRMELSVPTMNAVIEYTGGDTLFVYYENEDRGNVQIRLLSDNVTLLNDGRNTRKEEQKVYILSQLPEGEYKIRLKKGNYVVEKTIVKHSPQQPGQ